MLAASNQNWTAVDVAADDNGRVAKATIRGVCSRDPLLRAHSLRPEIEDRVRGPARNDRLSIAAGT